MEFETLTLDKAEGIAVLTLNRPDEGNALNDRMQQEIPEALLAIDEDEDIRALLVTGAGQTFCSGGDIRDHYLKRVENLPSKGEDLLVDFGHWGPMLLTRMKKPTIAAINGPALGFGCTFAVACDIRIAAHSATMGAIFVRFGSFPGFGATYLLPRIVGLAKACELTFTGKIIDAQEAKEMGLVNQVVPAAQLRDAAYLLAKSLAEGPPIAIRMAKRSLYQGLDSDLPTQYQFECFGINVCRRSRDHAEGIRAFLENRKPVFRGE